MQNFVDLVKGKRITVMGLGLLGRGLGHLQPGAGLAGGLLGGNQGGADLHPAKLTKQG